jgi:hypothetical protein
MNEWAVRLASRYVFAHNLDCCPGVWTEATPRLKLEERVGIELLTLIDTA